MRKWRALEKVYYELGRPSFPHLLRENERFLLEGRRFNRLVGAGYSRAFLNSMSRRGVSDLFRRVFGGKKVKKFSPILEFAPPFYLEYMTQFNWISYREKDNSPSLKKNRIQFTVIKVTEHVVRELSTIRELQFNCFKYKNSKGILKRKFFLMSQKSVDISMSFPKITRFEIIRRKRILSEGIRSILPFKTSSSCSFMGFTPFKINSLPQKVFGFLPETVSFLEENSSFSDKNFERKYCVTGAWLSQIKEFEAFVEPVQCEYSAEQILDIVGPLLYKIELPYIEHLDAKNCFLVDTNRKASSGLFSKYLFKDSRHSNTDDYLRPIAYEYYKEIGSSITGDRSLWAVGGRSRLMSEMKIGQDLRSRLLLMPEGVQKIVSLSIIQEFYQKLQIIQKNNLTNEIFLGGSFFNGYFHDYIKFNETNFDWVLEFDLKRFDQKVHKEIIISSFCILRQCFPEGDEVDRLFLNQLASFLYKNVAIPGGFVFRISKSIPTGSPFTSIIGNLVNWINLTLTCHALGIPPELYLIKVFGDDSLIFFKGYPGISADDFSRMLTKITGHVADPCTMKNVRCNPLYEKPYSMLKVQNYYGEAGRSKYEVMEKALFPEYLRNPFGASDRIITSCFSAPHNFEANELLKKFFVKLKTFEQKVLNTKSALIVPNADLNGKIFERIMLKAKSLFEYRPHPFELGDFSYSWEVRTAARKIRERKEKPVLSSSIYDLLRYTKNRFQIDQPSLGQDDKRFLQYWLKF